MLPLQVAIGRTAATLLRAEVVVALRKASGEGTCCAVTESEVMVDVGKTEAVALGEFCPSAETGERFPVGVDALVGEAVALLSEGFPGA